MVMIMNLMHDWFTVKYSEIFSTSCVTGYLKWLVNEMNIVIILADYFHEY